jgi:hypothetical protein
VIPLPRLCEKTAKYLATTPFAPDSSPLATGQLHRELRCWNIVSGRVLDAGISTPERQLPCVF